MQGTPEAISDFANRFGCVPLAARALRIPDQRKAILAGRDHACRRLLVRRLGLVPAAISFAGGVIAMVISGVLPARRLYDAD